MTKKKKGKKKGFTLVELLAIIVIVGVLTTIVSFVSYYICTKTFLDPKDGIQLQIANII